MFLSCVSRPDITYAVNRLTKFLSNHGLSHWKAAKHLLRYSAGHHFSTFPTALNLLSFQLIDSTLKDFRNMLKRLVLGLNKCLVLARKK